MLREGVGLDDQGGARLAEIPGDCDWREIASAHLNAAFAIDIGQGGVHERRQISVGSIRFGDQS